MSRREKGTATYTDLPSGKVRMRIWVEVDGIEQRKSFTSTSKSACRAMYNQWLNSDHKVAIEHVKTVSDWADHWLEVYKKDKVSYPTYRMYKIYVNNHIVPDLGELNLVDVRPAHIEKMLSSKLQRVDKEGEAQPMSHESLRKLRLTIRQLFDTAIDNHLCTFNPADRVKLPKKPKNRPQVFTRSQVVAILDYLPKHPYGAYIAVLMYTGMRLGELRALCWQDVNIDQKYIIIRHAMSDTEDGEKVSTTKSGEERVVTFDERLASYLHKLPRHSMYVMAHDDGSPYTQDQFYWIYYKFFDDLNSTLKTDQQVPKLSPHKCRHTFATFLRKGGADLNEIKEVLGHSTIAVTQIYDHIDIEDIRSTTAKFAP